MTGDGWGPADLPALLVGRAGPAALDDLDPAGELPAVELVTVDGDGWPHVAWLGPGELLCEAGRLLLCLWPGSGTADNLRASGRALLHTTAAGAACTVRLRVEPLGGLTVQERPLAAFEARAVAVRSHATGYATVTSGPGFRLHEPAVVVQRWHAQLEALAELARGRS